MILEVQGLTKFYKAFKAVDSVSFSIASGKVVGFVGANGAGKSTTLKAILNLHSYQAGSIKLFGLPPSNKNSRVKLGFLSEHPYFYDGLKAHEFLVFYGQLSGLEKSRAVKRADELLELVGLKSVRHKLLREFSKGMNQRMGIAQAIVHEPELVILDEPMSGLDPMGRHDVRAIIKNLKSLGKTIFFSSHILPDIEAICDDVILIHKGKIVKDTTGAEILRSSVSYVEWTVVGLALEKTRSLFPKNRFVGQSGSEIVLHMDVGTTEEEFGIHKSIHEAGGRVVRMVPFRRTLEDVMFGLSRGEIS